MCLVWIILGPTLSYGIYILFSCCLTQLLDCVSPAPYPGLNIFFENFCFFIISLNIKTSNWQWSSIISTYWYYSIRFMCLIKTTILDDYLGRIIYTLIIHGTCCRHSFRSCSGSFRKRFSRCQLVFVQHLLMYAVRPRSFLQFVIVLWWSFTYKQNVKVKMK